MTFDPTAITAPSAPPPKTHNQPPEQAIFQQIDDLYDEAKNWADGEPIHDEAMHDAITALYDGLHDLGKQADALRVEKKKPLDEQVNALQSLFNPYIQPKKGKVDRGKAALGDLLAVYRAVKTAAAKAEADRIALAAAEAKRAADEAIRASSGNLAEREAAEELLADAKRLEKTAARSWKSATTGTGLRTVWVATLVDEDAAMEWCWARAKEEVLAVAQRNADEQVRAGVRTIPGFVISDEKVASAGRAA
ncbi:hypothetical protein CWR43_28015 [Rhizobium sullae]|uniref:Uncharacterized protein n=1 Tax=Rhizobium sullae TaxID=50338 RepID=A0A2N0D2W2_RHISU|nr:hypothetical protein [Rhizobium sullae]PKA40429.1 hypothetical protein CWR43_28015 [Rhizobium sullae]